MASCFRRRRFPFFVCVEIIFDDGKKGGGEEGRKKVAVHRETVELRRYADAILEVRGKKRFIVEYFICCLILDLFSVSGPRHNYITTQRPFHPRHALVMCIKWSLSEFLNREFI